MSLMRFIVTSSEPIAEETVERAYMSGIDRIPWKADNRLSGCELTVERAVSDSGNLNIGWHVEGHGRVVLSTGSLAEQFGPYHLPLELARGTIGRIRSQLTEWQAIGLVVSRQAQEMIARATHDFGRAAVMQANRLESAALAEKALRTALDADNLLAAAYATQAIAVKRRGGAKLSTLFGGDLGTSLLGEEVARQFLTTFNSAVVPACWRDIEASEGSYYWTVCDKQIDWCRAHGLKVCGGPLVKFDPHGLPDWLYLWDGDSENVSSFAAEFAQATVDRYRGKVDLWLCAARPCSSEILSLSEEDKLCLVANTIELIRSLDPAAPAVISFDQPWAEYMSRREMDFPPLHFADALVRAGLDLGGLMLEINFGGGPGCTLPRTPLELSRQLDYWALLGLPLYLSISVAGDDRDDPSARCSAGLPPGGWSAGAQQAWVQRYVPLILSKPYVRGLFWNQLRDSEPHDFPHAGLFDHRRRAKPALHAMASIRRTHLV